jgi:phosphoenolpyruvate-protein phosphotransferase
VAILARSLGLPALAGADEAVLKIADGTEVVLDGETGELRRNPSAEQKASVTRAQNENLERRKAALEMAHEPAKTRDGKHIEVAANIGSAEDARQAVELGADGVGLLRSEFLFLERDEAPSEEEQQRVYQEIADILGPRPLVIRTLDVGGDKPLRYLPMPAEENPFLGVRGIRIGLVRQEILRTQLRAILKVRSKAKIHVMFPMISTLEELQKAKAILEEERLALKAPQISVGIMIEVPSAALLADVLAPEVDFFSIGTNDLTQYTLAMDRGHKDLAKQVDALHPSVLKLIGMTAQAGLKHNKWVGVCGGLASDLNAVAILLGLGVRELSVSLPSIPLVKSKVRESAIPEAESLAAEAKNLKNGAEVRELEKKSQNSLNNVWQGLNHVASKDGVLVSSENR